MNDDTFDSLMTRHLSARLDGQLGRAEAAFRQQLGDGIASALQTPALASPADFDIAPLHLDGQSTGGDGDAAIIRRPSPSFWQRPAGWIGSVAATALAASLATVMLLPQAGNRAPTDSNSTPPNQIAGPTTGPSRPDAGGDASPFQPMMRYVHNRTLDEGTVSPGNADRAVRQLRHQQVERFRYYDKRQGAWVDVVIPQEGVEYYVLDTY